MLKLVLHPCFLCHGGGQVSKVLCRTQRNTDALLTRVAMVAKPADRPTIITTEVIHWN
jgi:hypothetical protein